MDSEIKARWVAALRSGEREQAKGFLRQGDAYCCLGVLCDLVDPDAWQVASPEIEEDYDASDMYVFHDFVDILPDDVVATAGLSAANPRVVMPCWHTALDPCGCEDGRGWIGLSVLNDDRLTFGQIADLIEAQL